MGKGAPSREPLSRVRQSLCGRCEQAASFTEATCFHKMPPSTEHDLGPTQVTVPEVLKERRGAEQWLSGCGLGCRLQERNQWVSHGADNDGALWSPPGLSGGCHPQTPLGLFPGKPSRTGERVSMVTGRLIHLAHFRGSQRHPVLSVWVSLLVDLRSFSAEG